MLNFGPFIRIWHCCIITDLTMSDKGSTVAHDSYPYTDASNDDEPATFKSKLCMHALGDLMCHSIHME